MINVQDVGMDACRLKVVSPFYIKQPFFLASWRNGRRRAHVFFGINVDQLEETEGQIA